MTPIELTNHRQEDKSKANPFPGLAVSNIGTIRFIFYNNIPSILREGAQLPTYSKYATNLTTTGIQCANCNRR